MWRQYTGSGEEGPLAAVYPKKRPEPGPKKGIQKEGNQKVGREEY